MWFSDGRNVSVIMVMILFFLVIGMSSFFLWGIFIYRLWCKKFWNIRMCVIYYEVKKIVGRESLINKIVLIYELKLRIISNVNEF